MTGLTNETPREKKLRDALEDMCHQFGYEVGQTGITTGGLSALEHAFDVLGWDDPHIPSE